MNNRCDKLSYKSTAIPNVINMNSGVKMHYSPPSLVSSSSSEKIQNVKNQLNLFPVPSTPESYVQKNPFNATDGRVKRPSNCFIIFRKIAHDQKKFNKQLEVYNEREFSKILGIIWKSLEKRQVQMYKTFADSVANLHTTRNPNYKYRPKRNRAAWKHNLDANNNLIIKNNPLFSGIPHFGQSGANDNHNYDNFVSNDYLDLNNYDSNNDANNIDNNSDNNVGPYVINYGYTHYYETPYTLRSNESNSNVGNKSTLFNENNNNNIEDNFINTTASNNLDYNLSNIINWDCNNNRCFENIFFS
ncbi:3436_t:CDS:2 [Entrophospora sp. SA101]|nr:3436_t:CDS:2 [Entrophospora sp. SA101]